MAVSSTKLTNYSTSLDEELKRAYTLVYLVRTDSADTPLAEIRDAPNWGVKIHTYSLGAESDVAAVCNGIQVNQDTEDGRSWTVTVTFGWIEPEPSFENPIFNFDFNEAQEVITHTPEGDPIYNSAQDYLDPAPERTVHNALITVQRRDPYSLPPTVWTAYKDCINADSFLGYPPETVLCHGVTGTNETDPETGEVSWQTTYTFEHDPNGFRYQPLDRGYWYLDGNRKKLRIRGADGLPVEEAQELDGEGGQNNPLVNGEPPEPEDMNPPVFLDYQVYNKVSFAPFLLVLPS